MDNITQACEVIDRSRKDMIRLWEQMVNTNCGSYNVAGVSHIAELVADFLCKIGYQVETIPQEKSGPVLSAGNDSGKGPFILFMGHMDTVFQDGEAEKRPFTIQDGKAYGPGVLDMKGGIVILLYVLKALQESGFNILPFHVLLAPDEEVGHAISKTSDIFIQKAKGAKWAFNFETGFLDHSIVVERKGACTFMLETFGRSCHVGNDPENGRSAVLELAYKIIDIEKLTDLPKGYNLNAGVISGGTVPNAGPAYAKVVCNFRYPDEETYHMIIGKLKEIEKKQYVSEVTTKLTVEPTGCGPMVRLPGSLQLLDVVCQVSRKQGIPLPTGTLSGGGSDSCFTTALGIPTLCAMGVLGARNHTTEEFAVVNTLFERAKLLIGTIYSLSEKIE